LKKLDRRIQTSYSTNNQTKQLNQRIKMTFQEIFEEDGKYVAEGFLKGVCFEIKDETIYIVTYKNKDDLNPSFENYPVHKSLFNKVFKKVFTRNQLFR
jgi:hypothetical protein